MNENKEDKDSNLLDEEGEDKIIDKEEEEEYEEEREKEKRREERAYLKLRKRIKEEKAEKKGLERIVNRLKTDLDSDKYETLNQIYDNYINVEDLSKKIIKPNTKRCSLMIMFYLISPIFGIITLIGIFESIAITKIMFQVFGNSFSNFFDSLRKAPDEIKKFSIDDFNKKYNFYYMFFENVKKESYDFNLMMFFSFLGDLTLNSCNFQISIFIFGLISSFGITDILVFSFLDYDINDNTFPFIKILFLFIIWLILFIGVGASALLSQQIIIDSNTKYNIYLNKLNEETEKKRKQMNEKFIRKKTLKIKSIDNDEEIHIKDNEETKNDENKDNQPENKEKEENKENKEEKKKNKFDSFFMICLTTMLGYLLKYFINIIIIGMNEKKNKDEYMKMAGCENDDCFNKIIQNKNLSISDNQLFVELQKRIYKDSYNSFLFIVIVYLTCILLSIILYTIFDCIFTTEEEIKKKEEKLKKLGENKGKDEIKKDEELIEKIKEDKNKDDIKKEEEIINDNKNDEKNKNEDQEKKSNNEDSDSSDSNNNEEEEQIEVVVEKKIDYKVCEICGCNLYCESITLKDNPLGFCKECLLLSFHTCLNCSCLTCKMICNYFKRLYCCIIYEKDNEDEELDELVEMTDDYKKNKECFCYCYQTKRIHYWLNKYLTSDVQREIFPYMIEYFILQLMTLGFEKQYLDFGNLEKSYSYSNITNESNFSEFFEFPFFSNQTKNDTKIDEDTYNILNIKDLYTFLTFIGTFIYFFYFTLSFEGIFNGFKEKKEYKNKLVKTMQISNGILDGIHGILIFEGFFALIFSSIYLSNDENQIFKGIYLFLIPVLMNKFYNFTLIFYNISYSEQKKKYELISGSTLTSIYLTILELITSSIRESSDLKSLYITQIVLASILPCFLVFFYVCVICIACICRPIKLSICLFTLCCICNFICCFGGFYYWEIENQLEDSFLDENKDCRIKCDKICDKNCCADCGCCYCCFDFLNFFSCFDCYGSYCCSCCNCCECYDCCYCCTCFYCCGDSCRCYCCD